MVGVAVAVCLMLVLVAEDVDFFVCLMFGFSWLKMLIFMVEWLVSFVLSRSAGCFCAYTFFVPILSLRQARRE